MNELNPFMVFEQTRKMDLPYVGVLLDENGRILDWFAMTDTSLSHVIQPVDTDTDQLMRYDSLPWKFGDIDEIASQTKADIVECQILDGFSPLKLYAMDDGYGVIRVQENEPTYWLRMGDKDDIYVFHLGEETSKANWWWDEKNDILSTEIEFHEFNGFLLTTLR